MKPSKIEDLTPLYNKVVTFTDLVETDFECDVDSGMRARLIGITKKHDYFILEFNLAEFESHNDTKMKKNYYDRNGVACLNMKEAGHYTGTESVYCSYGYELPFTVDEVLSDEEIRTGALAKLSADERRVLGV